MSKLVTVYNVVVNSDNITYKQVKLMETMLDTTDIKFNGRFTAKCNVEVNYKELKSKIAEVFEVKDGLINISFYEK